MLEMDDERRVSYRMSFASRVFCHVSENGAEYSGLLRDISISGLFMETSDDQLNAPCRCELRIIVEGNHSRLMIDNLHGQIIRSDSDGMAIRFDERLEWFTVVPLYFHKMREH